MSDYLVDFDQVKVGASWNWPRHRREQNWHLFYANDFDRLFGGNRIIDNEVFADGELQRTAIKINWFRRVTKFYVNNMWADTPTFTGSAAFESAVDEALPDWLQAFKLATRYASVTGYGLIASIDSEIQPINPSEWVPVVDPGNNKKIVGHVIAYSYKEAPTIGGIDVPDRIKFVFADLDGTARTRTHKLEGQTIGAVVQDEQAVSSPVFVGMFGDEESDYLELEDIVREVCVRLTLRSSVLQRHSSPHLQGPVEEAGFQYSPRGMLFPRLDKDDPEFEYLTWEANLSAAEAQIKDLQDAAVVATGVPLTAFGLSGAAESGRSRERQMTAALNRLKDLRRGVEQAIKVVLPGLGLPNDDFAIDWVDDPFSTQTERAMSDAQLVGAGILTPEQAQQRVLGTQRS